MDKNHIIEIKKLGIVCPMANERDSCEEFVKDVISECRKHNFESIEFFIILDNASNDGTYEIIQNLSKKLPEVVLIFAPENKCVVDAYIRGYKEALASGREWILEIDAGYSHRPSDIHLFFETMKKGYDCVFGSRFCRNGMYAESSKIRYFISRGGTVFANLLLGTHLRDMTSGFELFTHEALQMIIDKGISSRSPFFQTEIKFYAHQLRIVEVPIHYRATGNNFKSRFLLDSLLSLFRLFYFRIHGSMKQIV